MDGDGDQLALGQMRSLPGMLEQLPHGREARNLAEKLGVWTSQLHAPTAEARRPLPQQLSRMSDPQLSDLNGYWLSEVHRVTELLGLLDGQKDFLTLRAKSVRAAARSRVRKSQAELEAAAERDGGKAPKLTAGQIADMSEEDPEVIRVDEQMGMLAVIVASVKAYKEGSLALANGISREISFRQAQMSARIRS